MPDDHRRSLGRACGPGRTRARGGFVRQGGWWGRRVGQRGPLGESQRQSGNVSTEPHQHLLVSLQQLLQRDRGWGG